ncbi:hypothetical protein M758_6G119600 [Ceratodon purpureus]|nr:hypothetical protein M758_6G119600 [Ceratodon purpureus]
MEARITSFEWKRPALEGRALLGTHAAPENTDQAPPPLISPVSPKHMKANYSMVATLTILMVIAVGAIFCCCYQWETRLRGQSEAQSPGHSELAGGTRSSSNPLQDSVPSISVIMPGEDIPRYVAWAAPQGFPIASTTPEARAQPEANQHVEKTGHNTVVAPNLWIPSRVSG